MEMFWKYWCPVILGIIMAILFRVTTQWYSHENREYRRIPRVLMFLCMALAFVPILNWAVAFILLVVYIIVLIADDDDFTTRELKDTKFNKWLFKN